MRLEDELAAMGVTISNLMEEYSQRAAHERESCHQKTDAKYWTTR